jgi:DNA invertase Pin-like site-specific DNA recombinase
MAVKQLTKTAVTLIRVSGKGQTRRAGSDQGYSLPVQREGCDRMAAELGARVVAECKGPAQTASKGMYKALKEALEIVEREDIDYLIVFQLDRFARNELLTYSTLAKLHENGTHLVSALERIDSSTPEGMLSLGNLTNVNAYRSRSDAGKIKNGLLKKVELGGTPFRAPIGYLNKREWDGANDIRSVILDPNRWEIVVWAFETYATGHYSLSDLAVLLEARGLRTQGSKKRPSRPLNVNAVHEMLRNPYYKGDVLYQGKRYKGSHKAIIGEELFERVQTVLQAHRRSGERERKHSHYLKGSIYCGKCGRRLTFSRNRGNGGTYDYFICTERKECDLGYQRVEAVEAAIEAHYATVRLSADEQARVRRAMTEHLSGLIETSRQELARCKGVQQRLKREERALLNKHYEDKVSDELYNEEYERIKRERLQVEAIVSRLTLDHDDLQATLERALDLVGQDLQDLYLRAKPESRRLMNQAIFEYIWIDREEVQASQLANPIAELKAVARSRSEKDPASREETGSLVVGSIRTEMVELGGFEPPTSWVRYGLSSHFSGREFRILERRNGRFSSETKCGCTSGYAGIGSDSGTRSSECPIPQEVGSNDDLQLTYNVCTLISWLAPPKRPRESKVSG